MALAAASHWAILRSNSEVRRRAAVASGLVTRLLPMDPGHAGAWPGRSRLGGRQPCPGNTFTAAAGYATALILMASAITGFRALATGALGQAEAARSPDDMA